MNCNSITVLLTVFGLLYAIWGARLPASQLGGSIIQSQIASVASSEASLPNVEIITDIPFHTGQLKSQHRSGYITVDQINERRLFWYLVESQAQPDTDPVVLWLNGGPGCSSFDGFVYEQGPFTFELDASGRLLLRDNPYSWDKVANILYLDSPAGVGLSYSRSQADYTTNDTRTAADAERFLRLWFLAHPEFSNNRFFIAGESYAGVYVPNLARAVVQGNKQGKDPSINIEGYLVGNGVTAEEFDGNALPLFAMGKSLMSVTQYSHLQRSCSGSYYNATSGSECSSLMEALFDQLSYLNVYDILSDCYHGPEPASEAAQQRAARLLQLKQGPHHSWPLGGAIPQHSVVRNWAHVLGTAPPCVDSRQAAVWLNHPAVRLAIHAEPIASIGQWQICSDKLFYTHDEGSMIPIHRTLIEEDGLRALVFSGDHDMAVPHTGSEAWTSALGYTVLEPWQPWFVADTQVAGYAVSYQEGLTYATVKGAGHMVPLTNPREALALLEKFISNQSLCSTTTTSWRRGSLVVATNDAAKHARYPVK